MLGELYRPRGKALEHARVILETDEVYAVNARAPVMKNFPHGISRKTIII